jgi:KaiC/GvpD/RAD55 family RecA-like ATPase
MYVKHPTDLTNLDIRLLEALKKMQGRKFLVVDSLSTLMVYNSPERTLKFAHMLSSKLPAQGVDVVYIALLDEKNAGIESVAGMCDKVIKA